MRLGASVALERAVGSCALSGAEAYKLEDPLAASPRLSGGGLPELFEMLRGTGAVERGEVLLVSLEPVQTQLGPRWSMRRDGVLEHSERHFRKHIQPGDIWVPLNETEVLVAMPGTAAMTGRGLCYRALTEVLTHFLGECRDASVRIDRVTDLKDEGIATAPLPTQELKAAAAQLAPPSPAAPMSPLSQLKTSPLRTVDGTDIAVSFAVDPVLDLKTLTLAGHRIEARLLDAVTRTPLASERRLRLLPQDIGRIDQAALERGLAKLDAAVGEARPWLILQLSFAGLTNTKMRNTLFQQAAEHRQRMQEAVICELVDVESGVPAGRLREVAAMVRPLCRAVFAQMPPTKLALDTIRAAGLPGATFRAADFGVTDTALEEGMRRFSRVAVGARPVLTVTGLPNTHLLVPAMGCGFTHATVRAAD